MAKKKVKPTVVQAKGNYNPTATLQTGANFEQEQKKYRKKLKKSGKHPFSAKAIGGTMSQRHNMIDAIR